MSPSRKKAAGERPAEMTLEFVGPRPLWFAGLGPVKVGEQRTVPEDLGRRLLASRKFKAVNPAGNEEEENDGR